MFRRRNFVGFLFRQHLLFFRSYERIRVFFPSRHERSHLSFRESANSRFSYRESANSRLSFRKNVNSRLGYRQSANTSDHSRAPDCKTANSRVAFCKNANVRGLVHWNPRIPIKTGNFGCKFSFFFLFFRKVSYRSVI